MLIFFILAVGGVFLCRYKPRAYRPQPAADSQQVSPYLTHELGPDFVNQVQLDKPFELVVKQEGLNDIIRRQPWVEQFGDFSFTDPVVLFDTNTIYLMGTLDYKGVSSVLTIIAHPQMDTQRRVWMNIQSVRLGVIPVTALVSRLTKKAFRQSQSAFAGEPQLEEIVRAIIYNEPFDPVFKISDRLVRVTDLAIGPQQMTLRFDPE